MKTTTIECDYCEEGIPVNGQGRHVIADPEGIEGDVIIVCPIAAEFGGSSA